MTKQKVNDGSSDASNDSDIVVDIDTSDSVDHAEVSQPPPTTQPISTQPPLSPEELKKLKRFKSSFGMGILIFLYFTFQIVYIALHKFQHTYTFVLFLVTLAGNFFTFPFCFMNMSTPSVKNPVRTFLSVFAFINFVNACQMADIIVTPYSEMSTKEQVLFYFNIILLTLVGLVCTLASGYLILKFIGSRVGGWLRSIKTCIGEGNCWIRFYRCCDK